MEIREEFKKTEIGIIPEDWEIKSIGDEIDLLVGFPFASNGYTQSGVKLLRCSNIKRGNTDWSPEITQYWGGISKDLEKYLLSEGDIVIAMDGSLVGQSFARITNKDVPALLLQRVARVRSEKIDIGYLKEFICSDYFTKHCNSVKTVTAIPHISPKDIKALIIPIPPTLIEQQAIATALSDIDALIISLNSLINKKKNIRKGTIQMLFTGRKRLEDFNEKWEVRTLGECLLEKPMYGINASAVPYNDRLPAYIRITDISDEGRFLKKDRASVICSNPRKYELSDTDIVFARTGASTGKSYLYKPEDGTLLFAGFLIRIRVNLKIAIPKFIKTCVETASYWDWVRTTSTRSGQPGINGNEYASLVLQIPSLAEQKVIVDIINDMDAVIDSLEYKLSKYNDIKQGMIQELLTGRIRLL